ncbi:LETM1-domain-containing protein [Aaosphaeria arxii CBS 175.79]|uniref:LETM1-domain-containing protein n=1 Tax=Aaosphaeria arxii CBS 175.79 TaxID=1450172 RepID=A0A6A5XK14_9PLEO|nr:LETM1-domain-containing protein [Aaosphaeria arxii CBS 175.79]KAF2013147.1 LETM1-domain-containing protein [Aaosphaeria arxii CBS 175.79]
MYATRAASRATPAVMRAGIRTSGRLPRSMPRNMPAIAILLPYRPLSTETSTSSNSGGNFPPPGFNANQARKPLPKEEQQKATEKSTSSEVPDVAIPRTGPTALPKTKAEEQQTLTELAAEKANAESKDGKKVVAKKEEEKVKLTVWQKVKKEANHYWDGTKLLVAEVRISSKLALKMAAGYELTRREHRQLQRTVQDLGRLIPFSVFVIVPFAELLLPVALKLFPNLLPSTYEGQSSKDAKAKTLRATRKEVSTFLRQTLKETGLPVSAENAQREEFSEFFRKVRTTGESPSQEEIIKVCKIFKDDLTLDNLSRPQLVAICRYMNMASFGTDNFLRYQVRVRMRQIKRDDRAISYEGVDSLSVPELQTACASRGLRTHGVSPARLREDLLTWLELRLKFGVPSTLLVLSNAFVYAQGKESEMTSQMDALQAVLSSIPEELYHEVELEVHTSEGAATNKQRLEVLKEQQELIEEENEQNQGQGKNASPKDHENIDEDDKPKRQAKEGEKQESKEAEASSADSATGTGSAERAEQDKRALEGDKASAKEEQKST